MIDCQQLRFSLAAGSERQEKAEAALGKNVVSKILVLALYWLGGRRPQIATGLGVPENSLRTTVRVVLQDGLTALEDRRRSHSQGILLPLPQPATGTVTVVREGNLIAVRFGAIDAPLTLSALNRVQSRVVLLSLVNSGLISAGDAAEVLGLSSVHVRNLAAHLADGDVEALLDKRRGQQKEYVLTPNVKSQIVLQYTANAVLGRATGSKAVVADIGKRCGLAVSDRTFRHFIAKFGLGTIATKLPELVDSVKKGSGA
jgi:hypothetical protein